MRAHDSQAQSGAGEGRKPWRPEASGDASDAAAKDAGARWTDPSLGEQDEPLDIGLRPRRFDDFVGQRQVQENLRIALQAARARDESPDHILLCGPPGLGKTTLARIVAGELQSEMAATSGPALERPRDLVGILSNLRRGDVLFIDEIHRVPAAVEEYLYTAMEDFSIDFTVNEGPSARVVPLRLEPFTLVGATTREGLLTAPFRARFGLVERLSPYSDTELVQILERSAQLLDFELTREGATLLAERSRGTPRVANRFLRRLRDLAQVEGLARADAALAEACMQRLGVDANGLEDMDRRILAYLGREPDRPIGLKTIAAAVGESEDTIEDVFEPHLLRKGFLHKTARGRQITAEGARIAGIERSGELFP